MRRTNIQSKLGHVVAAFTISLFCLFNASAAEEVFYVQAAKAEVKSEPKTGATNVIQLKRGNAVNVLKKDGQWFQVSAAGKQGWILKFFLNNRKPVGEAEVAAELSGDKDLAKSARRRSSSYAVSATTRGAMEAGNRVRDGREAYASDFDAVKKLEKVKIAPKELQDFQKNSKLGE